MAESTDRAGSSRLARIEPGGRIVVLARTVDAPDPGAARALQDVAMNWARHGETCLGRALYRHRSVFRNASEAREWSHLELSYFHGIVPADAIRDLVDKRQPTEMRLLRAEILLTTPSAFVMPRLWRGLNARPGRTASLEYIDVQPPQLGAYRELMRDYIGPAAATLVQADRIGTFRAMETAAVLYQDPALTIGWNQIHLCEIDPAGFDGFGQAFDAALREISPKGGVAGVFARLDGMRAIPRWTFNDAVIEADAALAGLASPEESAE